MAAIYDRLFCHIRKKIYMQERQVHIMKNHFKLVLADEGRDVYMPRKSQSWGYRYGPTIMVEDGVCHAWFASPGDCYEADWFTYRKSIDGGLTWTDEKVVMAPVPDSMDWFSVCDPAVIKYGEYYYIGYTSTVFANGGGVCNNGFIGRSKSPEGPFERWNGAGWGEKRETADGTLHWLGRPAPVIYYDEDWHNWGAGEFSFVIKDKTIYIYYTWTSKDRDGNFIHETRVATADITNENWPSTIVQQGVAVKRPRGSNDSYDVVFCEDLNKFIALSTDFRFSEDSVLAVYESDDGLRFTRVNSVKAKTGWMCHNCGISGDAQHHIKSGDTMLLGYAYGNQWGCWGTRIHNYSFEAMEEDFYDETSLSNVHHEIQKMDDPAEFKPSMLYLAKPHFLRLKVGESAPIPMVTGDVTYAMQPVKSGVKYSNYDKDIITIRCGRITAEKNGYTYVTATMDGLSCEFLVYVDDAACKVPDWVPHPEREVVSFKPLIAEYVASLAKREMKQLRGLATYADASWFEVCGDDGVIYENHSPDLFEIMPDGNVLPTGKTGRGKVTLRVGEHAFDVDFTVTE